MFGLLIRWLVSAGVTMAAVRVVTPGNPHNTLGRALLVTFLAALLVSPFVGWIQAVFIIPLLIAVVAFFAIYTIAYDVGPVQAIAVAIMQAVIGWLVQLAAAALSAR